MLHFVRHAQEQTPIAQEALVFLGSLCIATAQGLLSGSKPITLLAALPR
jgi:hypothetical protein